MRRTEKKRAIARAAAGIQPKRGRPVGSWTPEIVRDRIRIGMIVSRMEQHALGELKGAKRMTETQITAGTKLLERCIPKAQAPIDVAVSGTIIVEERDPTRRPADYHRKGKASV